MAGSVWHLRSLRMEKQIVCVAILMLAGVTISAQTVDKTVGAIKQRYADIAEKARLAEADPERGEYGELVMNELTINTGNHQWRAVGIYGQKYKFFYKGGDSEEHLYPDQLAFVTVERKVSIRTYREEFLYSDAGALMFYRQTAENDDQAPGSRLVYFSGIKAIRIIEDGKSRDILNARDAATVKEIRSQSGKIVDIFNRSIKL